MSTPSELKYTKDHEWIKIEGNVATAVSYTHLDVYKRQSYRCKYGL